VHAEHRLAREEVEEAIFEHALGSGQAFLGRLEHHVQVAIEALRRREVARPISFPAPCRAFLSPEK